MYTQHRPTGSSGPGRLTACLALGCATLAMAACVTTRTASPVQVATSNPTVTYTYQDDNELIQANQKAVDFCRKYEALPRAQTFSRDSERRDVVTFECIESKLVATTARPQQPDLAYNYRTDQELLDVSRDAQVYCEDTGLPEMNSSIASNTNGSKTVTFRCSR